MSPNRSGTLVFKVLGKPFSSADVIFELEKKKADNLGLRKEMKLFAETK